MKRDVEDLFAFFEKLFNSSIEIEMDHPIHDGYCNCCFLRARGQHLMYPYHDGTIAQVFICLMCRKACLPEEPCTLEGCNFEDTYKIYVTNQDKNLPEE